MLTLTVQDRTCGLCGSTGHKRWRIFLSKYYICVRCWNKEIEKRKTPTNTLKFKDQRLTLDKDPRKHICTDCGNQIGDEYLNYYGKLKKTKRTAIHHDQYDETNVLAYTIEVCASCHAKREWTPERKEAYSQRIRELWKNGIYANRKRQE